MQIGLVGVCTFEQSFKVLLSINIERMKDDLARLLKTYLRGTDTLSGR